MPPFSTDTLAAFYEWIGIDPLLHLLIGGAAAACGFAMVIWNKINARRTQPTQDVQPAPAANGAIGPDTLQKS